MLGTLGALTRTVAQNGSISWIGVRPARREPMRVLDRCEIGLNGLVGDRRSNPGKRAVTLMQAEHLPVVAAFSGQDLVEPEDLRRNLMIAGINLLGLRKAQFRIGSAILQGTGLCAPCSRMEETLGPGGYAAVRGHGGITAEVVEPGEIGLGDMLVPLWEEG